MILLTHIAIAGFCVCCIQCRFSLHYYVCNILVGRVITTLLICPVKIIFLLSLGITNFSHFPAPSAAGILTLDTSRTGRKCRGHGMNEKLKDCIECVCYEEPWNHESMAKQHSRKRCGQLQGASIKERTTLERMRFVDFNYPVFHLFDIWYATEIQYHIKATIHILKWFAIVMPS